MDLHGLSLYPFIAFHHKLSVVNLPWMIWLAQTLIERRLCEGADILDFDYYCKTKANYSVHRLNWLSKSTHHNKQIKKKLEIQWISNRWNRSIQLVSLIIYRFFYSWGYDDGFIWSNCGINWPLFFLPTNGNVISINNNLLSLDKKLYNTNFNFQCTNACSTQDNRKRHR